MQQTVPGPAEGRACGRPADLGCRVERTRRLPSASSHSDRAAALRQGRAHLGGPPVERLGDRRGGGFGRRRSGRGAGARTEHADANTSRPNCKARELDGPGKLPKRSGPPQPLVSMKLRKADRPPRPSPLSPTACPDIIPGQDPKRAVPEKIVPKTRVFRSRTRSSMEPDLRLS